MRVASRTCRQNENCFAPRKALGEGSAESVKLSKRTLWVWKDPPGKADPPPEASFASSSERTARSVNSDDQSCVIEPRKSYRVGVFVVAMAGTTSERCKGSGVRSRPGSESRAKVRRVRRELGRTESVLGTTHRERRVRPVEQQPWRRRGDFPAPASEGGNQPEGRAEQRDKRSEAPSATVVLAAS